MNFLFSNEVGRLAFLGRLALSCISQVLGLLLFFLVNGTGPEGDSTPPDTFYLAYALACLLMLPGLFYFVRFAVMPRMQSAGIPIGYGFCLLTPSLMYFFQQLVLSSTLPLDSLSPWVLYPLGLCFAGLMLSLIFLPENAMNHGSYMQALLHDYETGEGMVLIRLVPLVISIVVIVVLYDFSLINLPFFGPVGGIYHGLDDAQSMDNAQLARQISRGQGYATMFLRPYALTQLHDHILSEGGGTDLFPSDRYVPGVPRILPDTYNAPGYPCVLAAWFLLTRPAFDVTPAAMNEHPLFGGERWIPELNQIFVLLTAGLVFGLGLRLFDQRVAWLALIGFLTTDLIWQYSITALSTNFLMFLITALFFSLLEIFRAGEVSAHNETNSLGVAWVWALVLALLLASACLTRLHLLVLLAPIVVFLFLMPRANLFLVILVALLVTGGVAPWFWHTYKVCGNPFGSNLPLLLYGESNYKGNQIFCSSTLPQYESFFKDASLKELLGFRWHFVRAWDLLGSNPFILLFGASILYPFKQSRTQAFRWLILGSAVCIIAVNNLGVAEPDPLGAWNTLVVLFPVMLVIGGAFFFILLDRLNLQIEMINNLIVTSVLVLSALPLTITLITPTGKVVSYPPYLPGAIDYVGRLAQPEEWVTSDMPWATAWYADHASLWLPDSLTDFEHFHDEVCPTGMLLITPVTLDASVTNLTSGEYKDWFSFITEAAPPAGFPLQTHALISRTLPEYILWSDRPRWQ